MADFLLSVGIETVASFDSMQKDITTLINRLNETPHLIKVGLDIDDSKLKTLQNTIETLRLAQNVQNNALSSSAPVPVDSVVNIENIKSANEALTNMSTQIGKVASSMKKLKDEDGTLNVSKVANDIGALSAKEEERAKKAVVSADKVLNTYYKIHSLLSSGKELAGLPAYTGLATHFDKLNDAMNYAAESGEGFEEAFTQAGVNTKDALEEANTAIAAFRVEVGKLEGANGNTEKMLVSTEKVLNTYGEMRSLLQSGEGIGDTSAYNELGTQVTIFGNALREATENGRTFDEAFSAAGVNTKDAISQARTAMAAFKLELKQFDSDSSTEKLVSAEKVLNSYREMSALLRSNDGLNTMSSYKELAAQVDIFGKAIEEATSSGKTYERVFGEAGINTKDAIDDARIAMAAFKVEVDKLDSGGNTNKLMSAEKVLNTYREMRSLLQANEGLGGSDAYKELAAQVEIFGRALADVTEGGKKYDIAFSDAGVNTKDAISGARTAMAAFRIELEKVSDNGNSGKALISAEKVLNTYREMHSLLASNKNAQELSTYKDLAAQLNVFDNALNEALDHGKSFDVAFSEAGIDTKESIDSARTAMSAFKAEIEQLGVSGSLNIQDINKQIAAMKNQLGKSGDVAGSAAYKNLDDIANRFIRLRELMNERGISSPTLEMLKTVGLDTGDAMGRATSAIADAKAEVSMYTKVAVESEKKKQENLNKSYVLLQKLKKAETDWSAAASGVSSYAYNGIVSSRKELEELIKQYENGEISAEKFNTEIASMNVRFRENSDVIKSSGENTKGFLTRLGELTSKFSTWFSITSVITATFRMIRNMISEAIELDSAMTELKKVTDETDRTYGVFLDNAVVRAKNLGTSLTDIVSATADFARLGLSIEEAERVADVAVIYKNVGDGISDIATASEHIISTMQAFGVEARNSMSIVDKFNEVGNKFAISSSGVGEALLRSASAMRAAGSTIDETIALAAAANTVIQDPDVVGTALKSLSLYLRAAKTEAEDAGESTDGMAKSVSELRSEILSLTNNKVDIQIDEDTFKAPYQILKELSSEWANLTDITRANLLELIGGKRNSNAISALLQDFSIAERALETSMNAAGSAVKENEKHLESIQGKIDLMKASFEALASTLVDGDLVKGGISFITVLIDAANWIGTVINSIGGLIPVLTGLTSALLLAHGGLIAFKVQAVATAAVTKLILFFTNLKSAVISVVDMIPNAISAWRAFSAGIVSANTAMQASIPIIGVALAALSAVVGAVSVYNGKIKEKREKDIDAGKSAAELSDSISELTLEYVQLSDAVEDDESARESLSSVQDDIIDKLGLESDKVQQLSEDYDALSGSIAGAAQRRLLEERRNLGARVRAEGENLEAQKMGYRWIDFGGDGYSKASADYLARLGLFDNNTQYNDKGGSIGLAGVFNTDTAEGLKETYKYLGDILSALEELYGLGNVGNDAIYNDVKEKYDSLGEYITNCSEATDDYIENLVAEQAALLLIGKELPKTKDEYDALKDSIVKNISESRNLMAGQTTDMVRSITSDMLDSQSWAKEILNEATVTAAVLEDRNKKVLAGYRDTINVLKSLSEEQEKNGGISSESYMEAVAQNEDLADVFEYLDGRLVASNDKMSSFTDKLNNETAATLASNGATKDQIGYLGRLSGGFKKVEEETDNTLSSLEGLVEMYQKANEGMEYNTLETLNLIEKYPELAEHIIETADGYKFEAEALAELIKLKAQDYKINESLELQNARKRLLASSGGNEAAYLNIRTIFSDYKGWRGRDISSWDEYLNAWEHHFGKKATGEFNDGYRDTVELLIKEMASNSIVDNLLDPDSMKNLDRNGKSDKKSDDPAWLKNFKEQYDEWNHLVAIGKKTQEEYITWLDSAYKSAFANDTAGKYIADKWKYEEEVYKHYDEARKTSLENTQKEFDALIAQCESEYKVHQNETKYIDALTEALRRYDGVITDSQRKSVIEKLGAAKYEYYDNVIGDIEHEAKLLERESDTEQKRIELYERAQKYLLEKKDAYLEDGYDATSAQLQKIETEYNSFADDITKIMEDAFDRIVGAQKKSMEDTVKSIDDSKEALSKVLDAVVAHIKRGKEAEIKALNDQKSEEKDAYDERKKEADEYYKDLIESAKSSSKAQVDSLEDQLKAYKDLIDARKELLQTAKDEEKYSRDVAEKNKSIAELQERIAVLSLDDSLSSKAERLKLEEELAKKQTDLADFQSDYSLKKQLSALDAEYDAYAKAHDKNKELVESQSEFTIKEYEKQKEAKLKFLEEEYDAFIDSLDRQIEDINEYLKKEGNLRREANALLLEEGETLWNTIMDYEYEYSEDITDLQNAWDVASGAMTTYNEGQRDCLETIQKMVDAADELNRKLTAIEDISYDSLVSEMKGNSAKWADSSTDERVRLHDANVALAEKFNDATGTEALTYDKNKGKWMLGGVPLYHKGGIVGGGSLEDNEVLAKLEKGEAVLDKSKKEQLHEVVSEIELLSRALSIPAGKIEAFRDSFSLGSLGSVSHITDKLRETAETIGSIVNNSRAEYNISYPITVEGSLDKDALPPLSKLLKQSAEYTIRQLTDPLRRKGIGQTGLSLSI